MDRYSMEILGKLHQKEMLAAVLHEQAIRRLRPRQNLKKQLRRGLFLAILVMAFLRFWQAL